MNDTPENKNTVLQPGAAPAPETPAEGTAAPARKRWFGRGVYGSKDVPIRVLDICIGIMIAACVLLTVYHSVNGGFAVTFEANGADAAVPTQSIRYGKPIAEPETPVRPGYEFVCWSTDGLPGDPWDFAGSTVTGDMTLQAVWQPAQITVKFDLAGGSAGGQSELAPITVTYGAPYGPLPTPEKAGSTFAGWVYSGQTITADTAVAMTGEHVLTAAWQ